MSDQHVETESSKEGFSYDRWYAENKERLSKKRARRYREDAQYRAAALKRSQQQRTAKKVPVSDGYDVSFVEAARLLDLTVWVLREWRRKDYFPEPHHRDGRLWFSQSQVELLRKLCGFFEMYGVRVTEAKRDALGDITALIYSNW